MKRRNKILSFLLAFALIVTAVPNEWTVRAPEAEAAGEEGTTTITPAENQLVYWDSTDVEDDNTIGTDGTVKTTSKEYSGIEYNTGYSSSALVAFNNATELALNEEKIREVFGESSGTVNVSNNNFEYQWYEEIAGKRVVLEEETANRLSSAVKIRNTAKKRTFICKVTLAGATIGSDSKTKEDMVNPENYQLTFERKYEMNYTGTWVEKENISEYFNGVDDVKDVTIRAHHKTDCYKYDDYIMGVSELRGSHYNSYFNYTWTAHFKEGKAKALDENTLVIDSSEHQRYLSSATRMDGCQFLDVDGEKKQVDYYECSVDLCYGYQVIDTISKKYTFRYEPFYINGDGTDEETIDIRTNGTAQMEVNARIGDTEAIVPGSLSYQWYEVDKDGNAKELPGETASSYTTRVKDPTVSYRVDVTAQEQEGFEGPVYDKVLSRTFKFRGSDGYLLKDISNSYLSMNIGDTEKLYVKPQVDEGYTLSYQWEKLSYAKDEEGNYLDEEGNPTYSWSSNKKVISEELGTNNECEVKPTKESDFEYITDWDINSETYASSFNYKATVTVKKGDETVNTHVYTFRIREDISCQETDMSSTTQVLDPGDDLELFVKTEEKGGFTQEKIWYEKVDEGPGVETTNVETGETKVVSANKYLSEDEKFEVPEHDMAEQGSFISGKYDAELGKYVSVYNYTFWKKVGDGDNYTKKGKSGSDIVDVRGEYKYLMNMYRASEAGNEDAVRLGYSEHDFTVTYDSDLSAYAKNRFRSVKAGEKAKLQVVAQTKSSVYKMKYKWEKQQDSADGSSYKVLEDVTGATYEISKAALTDAGRYRVTVSDEYGTELDPIYIWLSVSENDNEVTDDDVTAVCFTPETTTYHLGMGQNVKLKLDMKLSDKNADVFYAWYRNERVKRNGEYNEYYTKDNWELLGEDKDTYSLTIDDEEDYTQYKCLAVYRRNETEYAQKEVMFDVRHAYPAELERMTPATQIKKRGDSATYTVRLIQDDTTQAVKYQWYRYDNESGKRIDIEGATKETYTVNALAKGDFGNIYCEATDSATGERVAERAVFTTRVYKNGAYLETNYDTVEAEIDDAKTVLGAPEIARSEGLNFTYQWYRYSYDDTYDDMRRTIIYGATDATYTIDEIGDNEFGRYECEIYEDGDYFDSYYTTVVTPADEPEEEGKEPVEVSVREGYETEVKAFLGSSAKFAVDAKSNKGLDLKYQWYFVSRSTYGKEAIGGATEAEYEVKNVLTAKTGSYYCVVTDEEGNQAESERFVLKTTTGLNIETEGMDPEDIIGVQTTFGAQNVVLTVTATASTEHGYQPFFQWYHGTINDKGLLYGETSQTLTISSIDEDALGYYYCTVKDSSGADYTLGYYLYVNNNLNVYPSTYHVLSQADGSAKMYVTATANAGCAISYQWSKWGYDEEEDVSRYIDIEGAVSDVLAISPLTSEAYGSYRCVVSTVGEQKNYYFSLQPSYGAKADRDFARQGDVITVSAELENPASDYTYSYQWYEKEPVTGTYRRMKDGTGAVYAKSAPVVDLSDQYTGDRKYSYNELGYVPVEYKCVVTVSDGKDEWTEEVDTGVNVLPAFTYQTVYPETNHPNDKAFDLKGYQGAGAESLKVTFDAQTDLGSASLYVIDASGKCKVYDAENDELLAGNTIAVSGDSVVFLMNGNRKADSYGYKVSAIEHVVTPQPGAAAGQPGAATAITGTQPGAVKAGGKTAAKKGKKYTIKNLVYKVTNTSGKKKAVTVVGAKSKKVTSVNIPATVKIGGASYKVTAIAAKAFQGCGKLKKVTIGKNVKTIGASAFAKDKKLTKLAVKGTALKSVGKKAFNKVPKKAKIAAPKKSKKAYKKLLKKGGFKGKVK